MCIPNDVQLYKDTKYDYYQFPNGKIKFKVENIACIQALGEDKFGFNRIAEKPLNEMQQKNIVVQS